MASPSQTVQVKNISPSTSDKEIKDFFAFCGKITDLQVTSAADGTKEATVIFEKETAARTAQLLNNTQLGGSQIQGTYMPCPSIPDQPALNKGNHGIANG